MSPPLDRLLDREDTPPGMFIGVIELPSHTAMIGLFGGLVLLYAAGQALVGTDSGSPAKRAVAQWLPVALTAIMTLLMRRSDLAIGIVFATSVAALALGIGSAAAGGTINSNVDRTRRLWPFVLPTALLALLAGFSGQLNWIHAMILLVEGLVLLALGMDRSGSEFYDAQTEVGDSRPATALPWPAIELVLGILLAILGAWLAAHFTVIASGQVQALGGTAVATIILGPGLVLSMLGRGTALATEGRASESISAYVLLTLLNLCFLLPMIILLGYLVPGLREIGSSLWHAHAMPPGALSLVVEGAKPIVYPLPIWRLDTVLLVVLGLILLPAALGRWQLGRREGVGIIFGYWTYLLIAVALAGR